MNCSCHVELHLIALDFFGCAKEDINELLNVGVNNTELLQHLQ